MAKYKIEWSIEARSDLLDILEFYYQRNGNANYSRKLNSKIKKELKDKGKPIPENDIWIIALSKQHKIKVVSRDAHFENVANLELEKWL